MIANVVVLSDFAGKKKTMYKSFFFFFQNIFQALAWLCGRTPAFHAEGLGSIPDTTHDFYYFAEISAKRAL